MEVFLKMFYILLEIIIAIINILNKMLVVQVKYGIELKKKY